MIHVNRYERIWLIFGLSILALFLAIITATALLEGLVPPSSGTIIDPTKVSSTPPFDKPGVHQVAAGQYEAYYVAHVFSFNPAKIQVPKGSRVTFFVTTPRRDARVLDPAHRRQPGDRARLRGVGRASTFRTPGTYLSCAMSTAARAINSCPRKWW